MNDGPPIFWWIVIGVPVVALIAVGIGIGIAISKWL